MRRELGSVTHVAFEGKINALENMIAQKESAVTTCERKLKLAKIHQQIVSKALKNLEEKNLDSVHANNSHGGQTVEQRIKTLGDRMRQNTADCCEDAHIPDLQMTGHMSSGSFLKTQPTLMPQGRLRARSSRRLENVKAMASNLAEKLQRLEQRVEVMATSRDTDEGGVAVCFAEGSPLLKTNQKQDSLLFESEDIKWLGKKLDEAVTMAISEDTTNTNLDLREVIFSLSERFQNKVARLEAAVSTLTNLMSAQLDNKPSIRADCKQTAQEEKYSALEKEAVKMVEDFERRVLVLKKEVFMTQAEQMNLQTIIDQQQGRIVTLEKDGKGYGRTIDSLRTQLSCMAALQEKVKSQHAKSMVSLKLEIDRDRTRAKEESLALHFEMERLSKALEQAKARIESMADSTALLETKLSESHALQEVLQNGLEEKENCLGKEQKLRLSAEKKLGDLTRAMRTATNTFVARHDIQFR
mmetsp:Transcript_16775/g.48309  ORF Transcript_16775/g.48309 Transcript_16775/m.48309 type:complete len:470 (-) Transcript_16775:13-1422(-)